MHRRTTVLLRPEEDQALRAAARAEGRSQSDLIRRGIAIVTAPYRGARKPRVGWLKLSRREIAAILRDSLGDPDA